MKKNKVTLVLIILIIILGFIAFYSTNNKNTLETGKGSNTADLKGDNFEIVEDKETLNTNPHQSLSTVELNKLTGMPMTKPLYMDDLKIQVKDFVRSEKPYAELEIANISGKDIKITDANIKFVLYDYETGEDLAKSKLENGSIVIKPNEVKSFKVVGQSKQVNNLVFTYNDFKQTYWFGLENKMIDTQPLKALYLGELATDSANIVYGNEKLKFQVTKAVVTNNKSLGEINIGEQDKLLLVKFQIANTSNEDMKINKVTNLYANTETKSINKLEINEEVLKKLGSNLIPMTIKPNTIVEGYLPAIMKDDSSRNILYVETNLGDLSVQGVENISPW